MKLLDHCVPGSILHLLRPRLNVRIIDMLRSFFGSLSRSTWAQRTFSSWGIAKKLASRFIAGESSSEAIWSFTS